MLCLKLVIVFGLINFSFCCVSFAQLFSTPRIWQLNLNYSKQKDWYLKIANGNCKKDGNDVVKVLNSTMELNDNCDLIATACVLVRPFKTAKLKVKAVKNHKIVLKLALDLCKSEKPKNEIEGMLVKMFGLGGKCNINETATLCINKKIILEYSNAFGAMLNIFKNVDTNDNGMTSVETIISHDTGKTCFTETHKIYAL
jgi:hypothetical protein